MKIFESSTGLHELLARLMVNDPAIGEALFSHCLEPVRILAQGLFQSRRDLQQFEESDDLLQKTMENTSWSLFTDGGSRGNPGPAAYGFHLIAPNGQSWTGAGALGNQTNNFAEYQGIIHGLEAALEKGVESLEVFCDSELAVKQLNGEYRVKDPGLKPLVSKVKELTRRFKQPVQFLHIRRERNRIADSLVNMVLDGKTG